MVLNSLIIPYLQKDGFEKKAFIELKFQNRDCEGIEIPNKIIWIMKVNKTKLYFKLKYKILDNQFFCFFISISLIIPKEEYTLKTV